MSISILSVESYEYSARYESRANIYIYIYSTICRHACFGVLRLVSAAWYTSKYARHSYLYPMNMLSPRHVEQHCDSTHPDMRRA